MKLIGRQLNHILLVGCCRVIKKQNLYIVENATTEEIYKVFESEKSARQYAILNSDKENEK